MEDGEHNGGKRPAYKCVFLTTVERSEIKACMPRYGATVMIRYRYRSGTSQTNTVQWCPKLVLIISLTCLLNNTLLYLISLPVSAPLPFVFVTDPQGMEDLVQHKQRVHAVLQTLRVAEPVVCTNG